MALIALLLLQPSMYNFKQIYPSLFGTVFRENVSPS